MFPSIFYQVHEMRLDIHLVLGFPFGPSEANKMILFQESLVLSSEDVGLFEGLGPLLDLGFIILFPSRISQLGIAVLVRSSVPLPLFAFSSFSLFPFDLPGGVLLREDVQTV